MKRVKGGITIFLCLVITVILSLVCTLIESARVHSAMICAKSMTNMATEFQFANYTKQLFDEYGLLAVWEQNDIREEIKNYIAYSNNKIDIRNEVFDLTKLTVNNLDNSTFTRVTDDGGDVMVSQILDYEKYEMSAELLTEFLKVLDTKNMDVKDFEKAKEYVNTSASKDFDNAKTEENKQLVLDLEEGFSKIYEVEISRWRDDLDNTTNKDKKSFKKLRKRLKGLNKQIEELNPKILEYKNLQKKLGNSAGDWILEDINATKEIKDKSLSIISNLKTLIGKKKITVEEKQIFVDNISKDLTNMCTYQQKLCSEKSTVKGEEAKGIFEAAKDLVDTGILELVMPKDMEISTSYIDTKKLPSQMPTKSLTNPLSQPINKGMYIYYLSNNFGSVVDKSKGGALNYELEYILMGNDSDKENLVAAVEALLLIRQTLNTVALLKDAEKMTLCSTLATSISAYFCLPFLQPVIKAILIQAWCLVESVYDVRCLLSGKEVVLIKDITNWKTSIYSLAIPESENSDKSKGAISMDYETYICILLAAKNNQDIIFRMMDLMESNISKKYNSDFKLRNCIVEANVQVDYVSQDVFMSISLLDDNEDLGGYLISTECIYGY